MSRPFSGHISDCSFNRCLWHVRLLPRHIDARKQHCSLHTYIHTYIHKRLTARDASRLRNGAVPVIAREHARRNKLLRPSSAGRINHTRELVTSRVWNIFRGMNRRYRFTPPPHRYRPSSDRSSASKSPIHGSTVAIHTAFIGRVSF